MLSPSINIDLSGHKRNISDIHCSQKMSSTSSYTAPAPVSSLPAMYPGPPPPYTSSISTYTPSHSKLTDTSSPHSTTRRSTWNSKDSPPNNRISLPSLSEALANETGSQDLLSGRTSTTTFGQTFANAPKGPGNPFSQLPVCASSLQPPLPNNTAASDSSSTQPVLPPPSVLPENRSSLANLIGSPRSKQLHSVPQASFGAQPVKPEPPTLRSPPASQYATSSFPFAGFSTPQLTTPSTNTFQFEHNGKFDDSRNPFRSSGDYGETVKRHLDMYEAELTLNEITQISARTFDSSKAWSQRISQTNRMTYFTEGLPEPVELEEAIRATHQMLEHLSRLRDTSVMQQTLLREQQNRHARNQYREEPIELGDHYMADAKKRRGKAAPPGRCHSCNRAETPEWRRGPDGARTLCNACGLHYAKLTRKNGATKAASLIGSNLRPKSIHDTRS